MGIFRRAAPPTRTGATMTRQAMTAAARQIEISPEKRQEAYFKKREEWQSRVWEIHDELGIVREASRFHGDAFFRIRQFVGVQPDPQAEPIALDPAGDSTLKEFSYTAEEAATVQAAFGRLRGPLGGRSEIMRSAGVQMFMAGDFWLVGRPDPSDLEPKRERWDVYSVDELIIDVNQKRTNSEDKTVPTYKLKVGGSTTTTVELPVDTYVWRIWRPHPRFCADDQTEIFTRDGWKRHEGLAAGEEVLTLNHETGLSEWQPVKRVNSFHVENEPMLSIEGRGHSSLTTLDHRWPTIELHSRNRRWRRSATLKSNDLLVTAAPCADLPTEAKWSDAFVELVAWYWTEGSKREVQITQSDSANPAYVARIRRVLHELFGPASESLRSGWRSTKTCSFHDCDWPTKARDLCNTHNEQRRRGVELKPVRRRSLPPPASVRPPARWREYREPNRPLVNFYLNATASEELRAIAPRRIVSLQFIRELTAAQLELFIETSVDADGTRVGGCEIITQADEGHLVAFDYACVLAGRAPRHTEVTTANGPTWRTTPSRQTTWGVEEYALTNQRSEPTNHPVPYTGTVWCPTTANGSWLARRKGTVYFTGNSEWADAPMKAALPICERLLLLEKSINSGLMSRAKGPGVWIWPNTALNRPVGNEPTQDGQAANLPVVNDLITGMGTAINDPASAFAQVPIIIGVDDDLWKDQDWSNKLITWDREIDKVAAEQRTEARTEFAISIDLPPEQLLGLGDINHWGAWKVSQETFQSNIEPSVMLVDAGLTVGFLRPIIRIEGVERPERFVIWHDGGELVSDPEKKTNAREANKLYLISNEATRRELGYSETDAPSPEEIAERVAIDAARSGRTAPVLPGESAPQTGPSGVVASALTGLENLPALLGTMDTNLLRDVQAEADAAMRRALERANARLRSLAQKDRIAKAAIESVPADSLLVAQTLGPRLVAQLTADPNDPNSSADLFGGAFLTLGGWYDRRVGRVTAETIRLARQRGSLSIAEADQLEAELAQERATSWQLFLAGLTAAAAVLLGRPEPPRGPGEFDGRFVTPGMARAALAKAGGGGAKAVSLLTGDMIDKLWSQAGISFEAWRWEYGDPSARQQPFPPHQALDGVEFPDPDSDTLGAKESWPGVSHWWPSDHPGCLCSVVRIGAKFTQSADPILAELGGPT